MSSKFGIDHLIVLVCSVFTFTVFAPLEIFFSNSHEIWMDVYDILPMCLLVAGALGVPFIGLAKILSIFKESVCNLYVYMVFSFTIILYVLGNFIPTQVSMMDDGTSIEWLDVKSNTTNVLVIIVIISILVVFFKKKKEITKTIRIVSLCLLALQLYTLVFTSFISPGKGWERREELELTQKNLYTFSSDKNFTIFVLDQYDSRVFSKLLEEGDENLKALDGFTYFPDTVCKYNFTDCAVPHIISGEEYTHQSDFDDYLDKAYSKSKLLNGLKSDGYSVNIYTYDVPVIAVDELADNCLKVNVGVSSHRTLIKYIYKLVGCKYLPYYLKQYCWFPSDDLEDLKDIKNVDGKESFDALEVQAVNVANTDFYKKLDYMTTTDEKMFHFIHIRGIHGAWTHDRYMQETDQTGEWEVAHGVLFLLNEWIEDLKAMDSYDNNAIIILADHGCELERDEDDRSQNALFMVKGIGEHHELEISPNRVSYDQLDEVYSKLLNGEISGKAVEDFNGQRKFYKCEENKFTEGKLTEYCADGYAWEVNLIHETGNEFVP